MNEKEMAEQNLILKVRTGSHLYGTTIDGSDEDYLGVFIPSKEYILGLKRCEQIDVKTNPVGSGKRNDKDDIDITLYSLPKYVKLCADNNPNIVETLFVDRKNILFCNEFGNRLLEAIPFFISKKVKHRFLGYAHSQRQKLLFKQAEGGRMEYYEKYGFDTKFASHLIRLLTEGLELLVDCHLSFPITHNQLVRDIRIGKFTMDQVLAKADQFEALIEEAYVKSTLPYSPDYDAISKLQMTMLEDFWKEHE